MGSRLKAEQILCDKLYRAGILPSDCDMQVHRIDFDSPWFVYANGKEIGKVKYNPKSNRFKDFIGKHKYERKNKPYYHKVAKNVPVKNTENSILEHLKASKINIMG